MYNQIIMELDDIVSSLSPEVWIEERDPHSPQYWLGSICAPRRSIVISVLDLEDCFKIVARETRGLTNIHEASIRAREEVRPKLDSLRRSVRAFLTETDRAELR